MVEATNKAAAPPQDAPVEPGLQVAPGPHLSSSGLSTRRLMIDVLIALIPVFAMALYLFRWYAVLQVGICVVSCLAVEAITSLWRGSRPSAPGRLGHGHRCDSRPIAPLERALVCRRRRFGGRHRFRQGGLRRPGSEHLQPGDGGARLRDDQLRLVPRRHRLRAVWDRARDPHPGHTADGSQGGCSGSLPGLWALFVGNVNGSLGETSVLACLVGGLYLCLRRSAVWQIPISMLVSAAVVAGLANLLMPATPLTVLQHLTSGALVFSAFFIATDPVTSPLTGRGQVIFGAGTRCSGRLSSDCFRTTRREWSSLSC